jgi:CheY-like chemotaxis protein
MMTSNPLILVAEDSDEDFAAFTRIVQTLGLNHPIHRVCDGDEALDYLYRTGNYTNPEVSPRPSMILLDLNMPGTDGREVIQQVKQDEHLRSIPIVVLTTSSNHRDVSTCYYYGINSYLIKPIGFQALKQTVQAFFRYWLELNVLPQIETP